MSQYHTQPRPSCKSRPLQAVIALEGNNRSALFTLASQGFIKTSSDQMACLRWYDTSTISRISLCCYSEVDFSMLGYLLHMWSKNLVRRNVPFYLPPSRFHPDISVFVCGTPNFCCLSSCANRYWLFYPQSVCGKYADRLQFGFVGFCTK